MAAEEELFGTKAWPEDREWFGDWQELIEYNVSISDHAGSLADHLFVSKQEAFNAGLAVGAHLVRTRGGLNT